MVHRAPAQQAKPVVSPRGGPPGTEVTLTMAGMPPIQSVRIGFGSLSQYEVIGRADADGEGRFTATIRVPQWGELDRAHYFVLSFGNQMPRVHSEPFHVTAPDGTARIFGTISAERMSCLSVDGPENTLYTLQDAVGNWAPGQRVLVIGTVADGDACGGQGLPIAVGEIQRF